ncbi:MAG: methyltransferase domain-containing protein, partial [Deltaproteobacteria bacterium]|nr:methyltransferase domain-containing protein [Deltaproteobacteria bacterium]
YVWRVCEHDGWLYVGTYNASVFLPFKPFPIPEEILRLLKLSDSEEFQTRYGGCHLWRSPDGEHFLPVTTNGFGSTYNHGIRQLCSTPKGLFVGTSNPFGPNVGVKRDGAWHYEDNPRGGLEVWRGERSHGESRPAAKSRALRLADPHRETAVTDHRETLASLASLFRVLVYTRVTEDFYEHSGYTQMGYWRPGTANGREACDNLMEALLALVPDKGGRVLEIECGQGATTEALLRHYPEDRITGVDPFPLALDIARARMPRAAFEIMSPTMLHFPDNSFRSILSAERACYFNTRRDFLREAFRVLEPGGRLVLSDILHSRTGEALSIDRHRQNYLSGPRAYEQLLEKMGYVDIQVIDATSECAQAYLGAIRRHYIGSFMKRKTTEGDFNTLMGLISLHALFLRHYVLVGATKPPGGRT